MATREMKLLSICLAAMLVFGVQPASAELKTSYEIPEKLTDAEMQDGPTLYDSLIYPQWGVACTNFTYSVVYLDDEGREPEYIRINLNGEWHDMTSLYGSAETGETFVYNYVPTSNSANFYYIEASNGAGKAREAIIDSPDQGPIIYDEKFDNNQIILLDKDGNEVWTYDTGTDQVESVSISKDGNYAAAATNQYIYLFSTESGEPIWRYGSGSSISGSTTFAGVAISSDGKYISGTMGDTLCFFDRISVTPLWSKYIETAAIGIDMSDDGSLIAVGTANAGENGDKFFLFDSEGNKITEYKAEHPDYVQTGNFYQPDMTPDGDYISVSTGCPDRRAYLFSGDGDLIFRTEQMTNDSPVHKSGISDDGELIAYSADNSQGNEIVFLFDGSGNKIWGFSSDSDSTARGVSISADGNYIAAGTVAGNIYLFNKNSNSPLWKFSENVYTQIGEVKLNGDGSLLAAGGTSKKIYLFGRGGPIPLWEYEANTWVTKLDFNGEYIIAGTGLREYIGEGMRQDKESVCDETIQPELPQYLSGYLSGTTSPILCKNFSGDEEGCLSRPEECFWIPEDEACDAVGNETDCADGTCDNINTGKGIVCGDGICERPEDKNNCYEDCCGESCDGNFGGEDTDGNDEGNAIIDTYPENDNEENGAENESSSEPVGNNENVQETPENEEGLLEKIINFLKNLFF